MKYRRISLSDPTILPPFGKNIVISKMKKLMTIEIFCADRLNQIKIELRSDVQ